MFYRLKKKGFEECRDYSAAYADCCRGRVFSVVWSCRDEMKSLSMCMDKYTSKLEELKAKWVAAGRPDKVDWDELLEGF